jgi:1-acyl-sn-glycerol-3-phosphate acyltransferase
VALRTLLGLPVAALASLGLGLACLIAGLAERSGARAHRVIRLWARCMLGIAGLRVTVRGLEALPDGPAVYAANHASVLDIPLVFGHLPVDFRIVHKRSLRLIPLVGWCLHAAGHIAIDRSRAFRARRSLEAAAERIRKGTSVVVFPEGTRSRSGQVGLFKRGSFTLALEAGVPVVPMSLVGVRQVAPGGLLSLRAGSLAVHVHTAVDTAGRSPVESEALAEEVRRMVIEGCEREP